MQRPNPALAAGYASDNAWRFGIRASAFLGNRMLPLHRMFSDVWEGAVHIDDRNLIHSKALAEAFAGRQGWELSFGVREQMSLRGNRDTAEAFALLKGKKDLPAGRIYHAELEGDGFVAEELRIAVGRAAGTASGFSFGGALGLLHGERIQKGDVTGTLQATGPRSYDYALTLDYAYDLSYLYRSPVPRAGMDGYGYAVDLGAAWRVDRFLVSLRGEDLFSAIYWSGVPLRIERLRPVVRFARVPPVRSADLRIRGEAARNPAASAAPVRGGGICHRHLQDIGGHRPDGRILFPPPLGGRPERRGWWVVVRGGRSVFPHGRSRIRGGNRRGPSFRGSSSPGENQGVRIPLAASRIGDILTP
jgi:hypothetical protein